MLRFVMAFALLFVGALARAENEPDFGFELGIQTMYPCLGGESCKEPDLVEQRIAYGVIVEVRCGGSPHKLGIKPGDRIVSVNKVALHGMTVGRFQKFLGLAFRQDSMELVLMRNNAGELYGGRFVLKKEVATGDCKKERDV